MQAGRVAVKAVDVRHCGVLVRGDTERVSEALAVLLGAAHDADFPADVAQRAALLLFWRRGFGGRGRGFGDV